MFDTRWVKNAQVVRVELRSARHARPRHREVWIRLDGVWHEGKVTAWLKLGEDWVVTCEHDPRDGRAIQVGNYWYDEEAILARRPGERPLE